MTENDRVKNMVVGNEVFTNKYNDAITWLNEELTRKSCSTGNSNGKWSSRVVVGGKCDPVGGTNV